ncbi:heat stress transcription factor A-5-like [Vicia villosa]|uniref:heat stress transcription factor A-5-like n=1 Tax=Vicia villosa TaxID=3911 RepID=UPI00273AA379|nr:heat stress transcription factor A-5-like [Vicia villosa]
MVSGAGAGGSGGPTKFLEKTYHLVDDPSTDEIVAWSESENSFIVKDESKLVSNVLDKYFKHSNFSSFIRQLNTYGFRKISHDQWEFYNPYFRKDQYYLLRNIRRRQAVHSHSRVEVERIAFEEEIGKLANEKASIELDISSFNQYMPAKKLHVENLVHRLEASENRHNNLKNSFEMVLQNPNLVEKMNEKVEFIFSSGFSNKRSFAADDLGNLVDRFVASENSNNEVTEAGNSLGDNDSDFPLMEVENYFADIYTNFEFWDFEDILGENNSNF